MSAALPSPPGTVGPVRWSLGGGPDDSTDPLRGVIDVVSGQRGAEEDTMIAEPEPDAVGRGWVIPPGGSKVDAIFVLSGAHLGIGRTERVASPVWLHLREVTNLDALGDPVDGLQGVEISMEDHSVITAGWTEPFIDSVLATLHRLLDPQPAPAIDAAPVQPAQQMPDADGPFATAPAASADLPAPAAPYAPPASSALSPPVVPPSPSAPPEPSPEVAELERSAAAASVTRAAGSGAAAALELEDVVYLGGYPGHSRRRKKCTASMDRQKIEVNGPSDLSIRIPWTDVRTIEVQNSDEARFRMNTKIHRDASALVIECEQEVTVLLEARDCPTIALRSAITQLLDGLSVVVV